MKAENYFSSSADSEDHFKSYEEQLLITYDHYLDGSYTAALALSKNYTLELGELDDDYDSEYDENDWEEEEEEESLEDF